MDQLALYTLAIYKYNNKHLTIFANASGTSIYNSWVNQLALYTLAMYYFNNKFKYLNISTNASGIVTILEWIYD